MIKQQNAIRDGCKTILQQLVQIATARVEAETDQRSELIVGKRQAVTLTAVSATTKSGCRNASACWVTKGQTIKLVIEPSQDQRLNAYQDSVGVWTIGLDYLDAIRRSLRTLNSHSSG
jgi:hypothetical protein